MGRSWLTQTRSTYAAHADRPCSYSGQNFVCSLWGRFVMLGVCFWHKKALACQPYHGDRMLLRFWDDELQTENVIFTYPHLSSPRNLNLTKLRFEFRMTLESWNRGMITLLIREITCRLSECDHNPPTLKTDGDRRTDDSNIALWVAAKSRNYKASGYSP